MLERSLIVIGYVLACGFLLWKLDRDAATVTHKTAMEAPRPIFEPAHDLRRLTHPLDCDARVQQLGVERCYRRPSE